MNIPAWMRWWVISCCGLDALFGLAVTVLMMTVDFSFGALGIIFVGVTSIGIVILLRYGDAATRTVLVILLIPVLVMLPYSITVWGFTGSRLLPILLVMRPTCILIAVWLAWSNAHTIPSGWVSIIVGSIVVGIDSYLIFLRMSW